MQVRDSHLTGRANLGRVQYPLRNIPPDGHISSWLPVEVSLLVRLEYQANLLAREPKRSTTWLRSLQRSCASQFAWVWPHFQELAFGKSLLS